jgi:hypothetical protein
MAAERNYPKFLRSHFYEQLMVAPKDQLFYDVIRVGYVVMGK